MESCVVTAVGIWFYSQSSQTYLYLMRNDPRHPNTWGLPGGKIEAGENLLDAIERECSEELGGMPAYQKLVPIEKFTSNDGKFIYHTFFCVVDQEFCPKLNDEHVGWAWVQSGRWPKPLHPGLYSTVNLESVQTKLSTVCPKQKII